MQGKRDGGTLTVVDPARAPVIAALARASEEPWLVVTATARDAERLEHELKAWIDGVAYFPAWETLPHEHLSPRAETVARRLRRRSTALSPRLGNFSEGLGQPSKPRGV